MGGQFAEERAEPGWEEHGVSAGGQVGAGVLFGELVGGEVADPLELEAEEQDECPCGADDDRQGVVGEALLQEVPSLVVVEEVGGFLAWDGSDGESAAESSVCGPLQEVADPVAALGLLLVEPAVEVVLAELGQSGFLLVDPGQ